MKLLGDVLTLSKEFLQQKSVESPRLVAESLLAHVLNITRMDLYLRFECPVEEDELASYRALIKRSITGEPLEYILSRVEFFGIEVDVDSSVLIPRPETEILVETVAKELKDVALEGKRLIDLCSGSGCMGLSLKKRFSLLDVSLLDLSEKALEISRKTAARQEIDVSFIQGDLLKGYRGPKVDFLVCNPPYISELEYANLAESVKGYEPKMALVGGETGLEFYSRLSRELPEHLNSGAKVFLEIGYLQGTEMDQIFSSPIWKKKALSQDWSGKDRFFFLEME